MIIPNNHYLITPRHQGYDIVLKCPDCGYHCEHLELGPDGLWPEEYKAMIDIEAGRVEMITQTAEEYLKELDKWINEELS